MSELFIFNLIGIILLLFLVMFFIDRFSLQKSKLYRQDLANMYIAGKIKKIAKAEDINLIEEFSEFAKITKNKKIDFEALDSTVERELQEKIAEKGATTTTDKDTPETAAD